MIEQVSVPQSQEVGIPVEMIDNLIMSYRRQQRFISPTDTNTRKIAGVLGVTPDDLSLLLCPGYNRLKHQQLTPEQFLQQVLLEGNLPNYKIPRLLLATKETLELRQHNTDHQPKDQPTPITKDETLGGGFISNQHLREMLNLTPTQEEQLGAILTRYVCLGEALYSFAELEEKLDEIRKVIRLSEDGKNKSGVV